jgi:hypothetical protein
MRSARAFTKVEAALRLSKVAFSPRQCFLKPGLSAYKSLSPSTAERPCFCHAAPAFKPIFLPAGSAFAVPAGMTR